MYLMSSVRTLPGALVSFPGEWYLETEIRSLGMLIVFRVWVLPRSLDIENMCVS